MNINEIIARIPGWADGTDEIYDLYLFVSWGLFEFKIREFDRAFCFSLVDVFHKSHQGFVLVANGIHPAESSFFHLEIFPSDTHRFSFGGHTPMIDIAIIHMKNNVRIALFYRDTSLIRYCALDGHTSVGVDFFAFFTL